MVSAWPDPIPLDDLLSDTRTLRRSFYARQTIDVARDLLGKVLIHGDTAGRIVEVEAYLGVEDLAAHASRGITERTKVVYGPPGRAYVYFIYGMYECLNIVAEPKGQPGCVLIRALEPLAGLDVMRGRRPTARRVEDLASGPGRLALAMDITRRHYGCDLTLGPLLVRGFVSASPSTIEATPRIGIRQCADWPLRFTIKGNRFVSRTPSPTRRVSS